MREVTDRELQLDTEELLSSVVAGETLVITVEEKPVARRAPRQGMSLGERVDLLRALTVEQAARRSLD